MREHFETTDHKLAEREVYRKLEAAWRCRIMALPISYHVDAVAVRGNDSQIQCWIEVKCRTGKPDTFDTYYLAGLKWCAGVRMALATGKPFIVAFSWDGEIVYHIVQLDRLADYDLRWGGRTKRTRDIADIEPMVHIPREEFTRL